MKRSFWSLSQLWFLSALPLAAATVQIYVTNSAGTSVHVIDPDTNKVVQVIEGIELAHGVDFSPDGSRIYLSNESENVLDVIDRKSGRNIRKVPLSGRPNNIEVTKDGRKVLVCIADAPGALDVIDTTSLERVKSIAVKGGLHNVYVTSDGKFAVVGSLPEKLLTIIDLQREAAAWTLQFERGVRPMAIESALDGSTRRLFIQLSKLNGFAVVDFEKRKEVARIKFPDKPSGFGVAEGRTDVPAHGIGVAPDGKTLWANSSTANAVFVYSLPELKLLGHVPLPELRLPGRAAIGAVPNWITFTPDSKTAYISNSADRSVSAIEIETMRELARIQVGEVPKRIRTLVLR